MPQPATPTSWSRQPLPAAHATIALDRLFTPSEMSQIRLGVIPEQMEDKWFIYWLDNSLHFHRSWTGICLYVVRFVGEHDGYRMVGGELNRDPQEYGNLDDEHDRRMIPYLIDRLLLGVPAAFPDDDPNPAMRAVANWSLVGRAMFGQRPGRPVE